MLTKLSPNISVLVVRDVVLWIIRNCPETCGTKYPVMHLHVPEEMILHYCHLKKNNHTQFFSRFFNSSSTVYYFY